MLLSFYLLHLYQQNKIVEDALTFAKEKVAYKLVHEVKQTNIEREESHSKPTVLKFSIVATNLDSRKTPAPQTREGAGSSLEPHWRDVDMSTF